MIRLHAPSLPRLRLRQRRRVSRTTDIDFSGIDREADGFCDDIHFDARLRMCDQTRGAPFTFPIDGEPNVSSISGLEDGNVRHRAGQ